MTTAAELVATAAGHVRELDPEGFAAEAGGTHTILIDVREAEERRFGTIPGAAHVPRGMLEFRSDPTSAHHDARLHPQRRILLHCADGARSALAAETLQGLGYTDVAHLAGGLDAWRRAGKPLVNEVVQPY